MHFRYFDPARPAGRPDPCPSLQVRLHRRRLIVGVNRQHSVKYFMIVSRLHGLVLDVAGSNKNPGARVITWTKTGEDNQLWYEDNKSGTIRSKLNDFCLEAEGNLQRTQNKNEPLNITQSRKKSQYAAVYRRTEMATVV